MTTRSSMTTKRDDNFDTTVWGGLLNGDDGAGVTVTSSLGGICVQASGTWGGATLALQGSVDGSVWGALHDLAGNAISFTQDGFAGAIAERPPLIRPAVSGGDGSTALSCWLAGARR